MVKKVIAPKPEVQIETKYIVKGNSFDTKAEAEKYLRKTEELAKLRTEWEQKRRALHTEADKLDRIIWNECAKDKDILLKKQKEFMSLELRHIQTKVDDYRTQIKKLQTALKICRGAGRNYQREALAKFKKLPETVALDKKRKRAQASYHRKWSQIYKLDKEYKIKVAKLSV
jgi:hypothetical protein